MTSITTLVPNDVNEVGGWSIEQGFAAHYVETLVVAGRREPL